MSAVRSLVLSISMKQRFQRFLEEERKIYADDSLVSRVFFCFVNVDPVMRHNRKQNDSRREEEVKGRVHSVTGHMKFLH